MVIEAISWEGLAPPVTVLGFPVALAGLWLTWRQAARSRSAAEQAREAAKASTGRLLEMRLHAQVGHLERLIEMLNAAQSTNNHQMARSAISLWDSAAATVVGVIGDTSLESEEFLSLVRESRVQGNIALIALDDEARAVGHCIRSLRGTVQAVASMAREISSARFAAEGVPEIGARVG